MWWSFLAAIVGSSTALYIAICVYPKQKNQDRKLQIQLEQRKAYLSAIRKLLETRRLLECLEFDTGSKLQSTVDTWILSARGLEDELIVLASMADPQIIEALHECVEAIKGSQKAISDRLQERLDCSGASFDQVTIREAMIVARKETAIELDAAAEKLINRIRAKAFDREGQIRLESRILDRC